MSDKAFEAFKKDNGHAMWADYISFGALAIIKWVKRAWQAATIAERRRCIKKVQEETKLSNEAAYLLLSN